MSSPPAEPDSAPGANPARKRVWLGKLSTYLASFAGGAAVNDLSGTLGYHGLAAAVALLGVVTAASWIRGLDPRARLTRRAPWLFLIPAACTATAAAFSSGTAASILTAATVILTVGAILLAKELRSAFRPLIGAALIMAGAAVIAGGTAGIANGDTPLGAAIIPGGAAFLVAGMAYIGERDMLAGAAVIAAGILLIAAGAAVMATGAPMLMRYRPAGLVFFSLLGASLIWEGPMLIDAESRQRYLKRAGIGTRRAWYAAVIAAHLPKGGTMDNVRIRQVNIRVSPFYIAMLAGVTVGIVNGSTEGVTQAGTPHTATPLLLPASYGGITAAAMFVAWVVGPRTIASRARQAIDWAIKAPQATHDADPAHVQNGLALERAKRAYRALADADIQVEDLEE